MKNKRVAERWHLSMWDKLRVDLLMELTDRPSDERFLVAQLGVPDCSETRDHVCCGNKLSSKSSTLSAPLCCDDIAAGRCGDSNERDQLNDTCSGDVSPVNMLHIPANCKLFAHLINTRSYAGNYKVRLQQVSVNFNHQLTCPLSATAIGQCGTWADFNMTTMLS